MTNGFLTVLKSVTNTKDESPKTKDLLMTNNAALPRRKFLKTIGGAAVATTLPDIVLASASGIHSQAEPKTLPSVAVFWEPGFPSIQGCSSTFGILQQSLKTFAPSFLAEPDLIARLNTAPFDLLITPYGSAFPKRAWSALLKYLRGGGNWLNLGGVPLARPVVRTASGWRAEPHQTAYHKRLGITQSFPIEAGAISTFAPAGDFMSQGELANTIKVDQIYELYVRLSSTNTEPDEAGSDGPREGVLDPLVLGFNRDRRPIAAPVIQLDRMQAEFAGGRWVFVGVSGNLGPTAISVLAQRAAQGASRLEVRSEFACYRPGETPALSVRVNRPKGGLDKLLSGDCQIEVRDDSRQLVSRLSAALETDGALAVGSANLPPATKLLPGLHHFRARVTINSTTDGSPRELEYNSGFWVYDDALMTNRKPLTVDNHFFYRDGQVFPVTGTTYMASDVHRQFLFDPNPFVWDNDFREMKEAGVNMVRTGIWTGWKKYMPEVGRVNEVTLRAFDAFLLTAHKYDIPIIFTFFAFLPETWGGTNAYLDPQAVEAQQKFISAFTDRCRQVDDVIWDFINEPSFCSPKHLWNCRPNYDEHEKAAWKQWLKERYPATSDEEHSSQLQQLWRTTGDLPHDLPTLQDFESVNLIDGRQPLKTLDYRLFAQDMFIRWVRQMTATVRRNGNPKQLITVGQDEGGLGDSPNMHFFASELDFTSVHNWWANDDLVWDSVLAKAPSKASLVEETGIMFYEKADAGAAWRTEQEASRLLERKMAICLAADGAGFIEWIWNTNPYMNSTNEVGIGFYRVDHTAKPELEPFLAISKFMGRHGSRLRERLPEPVVMVIPHSQMFSPRSFVHEATRRCVRAFYYHCGVPLQAVSEYTIGEYFANAKLIIVPAPRVLTEKCWETLLAAAKQGATVAISGVIDADDHWLPVERSKIFGSPVEIEPVSESEAITIAAREYAVRYDGEKMQRIEKAVVRGSRSPVRPVVLAYGTGRLVWSPLPLEVGDSMAALVAFYKLALAQARVAPIFSVLPDTPSVLVLPSVFRDVVLYTFVSETDRNTQMEVTHLETRTRFQVTAPAERTSMVLLNRRTGKTEATLGE